MAPKSKKATAAEKAKDVQDTEDPLQAVVLADSFETRFSPFTQERPRCLLPLANTPLIEYTFEFLANAGVEEVYVYCGAHTDQVEEYIQKSKWSTPSSPFRTETIRSTSRSIGDAMRDLDKRAIMNNDFVVVYGDVVSNMTLDAALAEHRARRAKDKNAIMTMVLREAGGSRHRSKAHGGAAPVFVVDPARRRCVHYEQLTPRASGHHVELDPELLSSHEELELRHDLIDCGIDICTPDVLALWSDNFDYEAPRRGFLHSVLKDYELNGKTIHTHIVSEKYAARVKNFRAYDAVSRDVVGRWAWPMTPESNLLQDQRYKFRRGNVFLEDGAKVSKFAVVGRNCVVGSGTSIAAGVKMVDSVVGRNCKIGRNCALRGAYVWDGVTLGEKSEVRAAVLGDAVAIGKNCRIEDGALVSYDVRIGDATTVKAGKKITRAKSNAPGTEARTDGMIVGQGGEGYQFIPSDGEDEDSKAGLPHSLYQRQDLSISTESISTLNSETVPEEPVHHERSAAGSFASLGSDDSRSRRFSQGEGFQGDAASSIYDSLQKGDDISTIQLELQGLRLSANASEHEVRRAVVTGLIKHICEARKSGTSVKQVLERSSTLIERTMFDKDAEEKSDQVDFLLLAQTELSRRPEGEAVLLALCNDAYLLDLLEEEGFTQWWTSEQSTKTEALRKVRSKTAQFIKALEEAESESDDDDDD